MLQTIAQEITKDDKLKIGYTSNPLEVNQNFVTISNANIAANFEVEFAIIALITHVFINMRIVRNFKSGFYTTALMKGSTRFTYLFGMYIVDVFHYLMFLGFNQIVILCFDITMPGFWFTSILWAIADPLFLYTLAYFCIYARDMKGSTYMYIIGVIDGFTIVAD